MQAGTLPFSQKPYEIQLYGDLSWARKSIVAVVGEQMPFKIQHLLASKEKQGILVVIKPGKIDHNVYIIDGAIICFGQVTGARVVDRKWASFFEVFITR